MYQNLLYYSLIKYNLLLVNIYLCKTTFSNIFLNLSLQNLILIKFNLDLYQNLLYYSLIKYNLLLVNICKITFYNYNT